MTKEVYCHAVNLFFEARGEPSLGQRWVLDVVFNRIESSKWDGTTICEIVTEPSQFSWYSKHKHTMPKDPIFWENYIYQLYENEPEELAAWERCYLLALEHYMYSKVDKSKGSDHYMTLSLFNESGRIPFYNTEVVQVIGRHIFFKSL